VDLHARKLLALGEDLQRLNSIVAWREAPFFDQRERAALQWAETLTNTKETHAPDRDSEALKQYFDGPQIVDLTYASAVTNAEFLGIGCAGRGGRARHSSRGERPTFESDGGAGREGSPGPLR
jgi:hypothetical protein